MMSPGLSPGGARRAGGRGRLDAGALRSRARRYGNPPVNEYAKLWHTNGIDGHAYGFGFDDTCDQSSFNLIFNPTQLTITLVGSRS